MLLRGGQHCVLIRDIIKSQPGCNHICIHKVSEKRVQQRDNTLHIYRRQEASDC
jgi:hypothetical protein